MPASVGAMRGIAVPPHTVSRRHREDSGVASPPRRRRKWSETELHAQSEARSDGEETNNVRSRHCNRGPQQMVSGQFKCHERERKDRSARSKSDLKSHSGFAKVCHG